MERDAFMALLNSEHERIVELQMTKGVEYAPNADAVLNFKQRGEKLDIPAVKVWAVQAGKHWDRIDAYCMRGRVLDDEPIVVRVRDLILYLYLLLALVEDGRKARDIQAFVEPMKRGSVGPPAQDY
jgi:hypothetical protein